MSVRTALSPRAILSEIQLSIKRLNSYFGKRRPWDSINLRRIENEINHLDTLNKKLIVSFLNEIEKEIRSIDEPRHLREIVHVLNKIITNEKYAVDDHIYLRNAAIRTLNVALTKEHISKKKIMEMINKLKGEL